MINLPESIKMVITDFDGIITDNCVYIDSKGEQTRKLNFKDIMAFSILKKNGYKIGIISGEENSAIKLIQEKFQIEEVHQKIRNKLEVLNSIIDKYNLSDEEFIYIGDDVNDIDALNRAKYAITVPNAVKKVLDLPHVQMTREVAGNGAFREIVDLIVK
ncbi:MAG: HAD-IIIA family hydrolase [Cyanobacteria bacterium SIG28]|nr:HAD-IIIA family hydrolase [Cyanobacteria bacterium SIG28]